MPISFLDAINTILWDFFEKEYGEELNKLKISRDNPNPLLEKEGISSKDIKQQEVSTGDALQVISGNPVNYLFFYRSDLLKSRQNDLANRVALILNRNLYIEPPEVDDLTKLTQLEQYSYLIRVYLDKHVSIETIKNIIDKIGRSIVTDLILLSKYTYLDKSDQYRDGKALAKKVIKEIDVYNVELLCIYVYLYKAIVRTNSTNPVEEYAEFYRDIRPSSHSNNVYLRLMSKENDIRYYADFVNLMLSTEEPYYLNILNFLSYLDRGNLDWIHVKEDFNNILSFFRQLPYFKELEKFNLTGEEVISITSVIPSSKEQMYQQKQILNQHYRRLALTKFEASFQIINARISKRKKQEIRDFARIEVDSVESYRDNKYLPKKTRDLIQIAIGDRFSTDFARDFEDAMKISEPLAVRLLQSYAKNSKADSSTISNTFALAKSSMKSRHCLELAEEVICQNTKDDTLIVDICAQSGNYAYLKRLISSGSFDISTISDDLLSHIVVSIGSLKERIVFLTDAYTEDLNLLYSKAHKLGYGTEILKLKLDVFAASPLLNQENLNKILNTLPRKDNKSISFILSRADVDLNSLADYVILGRGNLEGRAFVSSTLKKFLNADVYHKYLKDAWNKMTLLGEGSPAADKLFFQDLTIECISLQIIFGEKLEEGIGNMIMCMSVKYLDRDSQTSLGYEHTRTLKIIAAYYRYCYLDIKGRIQTIAHPNIQYPNWRAIRKFDSTECNYSKIFDLFFSISVFTVSVRRALIAIRQDSGKLGDILKELNKLLNDLKGSEALTGIFDLLPSSCLLNKCSEVLTDMVQLLVSESKSVREIDADGRVFYNLQNIIHRLKPSLLQEIDQNLDVDLYISSLLLEEECANPLKPAPTKSLRTCFFNIDKCIQLHSRDGRVIDLLFGSTIYILNSLIKTKMQLNKIARQILDPFFKSIINNYDELLGCIQDPKRKAELVDNLQSVIWLTFKDYLNDKEISNQQCLDLVKIFAKNSQTCKNNTHVYSMFLENFQKDVETSGRDNSLVQDIHEILEQNRAVRTALLHRDSNNEASSSTGEQLSFVDGVKARLGGIKNFITSKFSL